MMQHIYSAYIAADRKYHEETEHLEQLILRHKKRLKRLEDKHVGWYDGVLVPMAEAISKAIEMPYEIYGPFGLSCQTSVYFFVNGTLGDICKDPTLGLTVYPEFEYESGSVTKSRFCLCYDTGERTRRYPDGTIGELNDGNVVKAPLPDSMDDIVELLRRHN